MLARSVDIMLLAACSLALLGGILPFVLRRYEWVRGLCVALILAASLFGVGRVYISAHMAIDQLHRENKVSTASFTDGARYTWQAATTALPIFILAIGGLSAMALLPPRSR
jgi:hypothetical protein